MVAIETAQPGLTPAEVRHLGSLEKRIERGLQTFREVGAALLEIRDSRLYRGTHTSFEGYVSDRWQLERQRAYQLIGAAEVANILGEDGDKLVNEAQARELVSLAHSDPERVKEVMAAIEGPMTAPNIRKAVQKVLGPPVRNGPVVAGSGTFALGRQLDATADNFEAWLATKPGKEELAYIQPHCERMAKLCSS